MITIESCGPLYLVTPHMMWADKRGHITTVMHNESWAALANDVLPKTWAQENMVLENRNVLRGLHAHDCWKLVYVPYGEIYLVVLNPDTKEYWDFTLSPLTRQVLIPPDFANGHLVLSETAVFAYLWSKQYEDCTQKSYRWDGYGIDWPLPSDELIMSERDE